MLQKMLEGLTEKLQESIARVASVVLDKAEALVMERIETLGPRKGSEEDSREEVTDQTEEVKAKEDQ